MILLGDCLERLKEIADNSVDSVVTDPPYGLSAARNSGKKSKGGFMGKKWDHDVPSVEIWREVLRVLKPGGHLLSFGGTRTYHRMVCNIEDAGFEIRDSIHWNFGSGFPKSHDVSKAIDKMHGAEREVVGIRKKTGADFSDAQFTKQGSMMQTHSSAPQIPIEITAPATDDAKRWAGWGTALKPAHEIICMARKPLAEKTVALNVLKYGTGGLNIGASKIGNDLVEKGRAGREANQFSENAYANGQGYAGHNAPAGLSEGRWPANVILGCACEGQVHELISADTSFCNGDSVSDFLSTLLDDAENATVLAAMSQIANKSQTDFAVVFDLSSSLSNSLALDLNRI